ANQVINSSTNSTTCIKHIIHQNHIFTCDINWHDCCVFFHFNIITKWFCIQFTDWNIKILQLFQTVLDTTSNVNTTCFDSRKNNVIKIFIAFNNLIRDTCNRTFHGNIINDFFYLHLVNLTKKYTKNLLNNKEIPQNIGTPNPRCTLLLSFSPCLPHGTVLKDISTFLSYQNYPILTSVLLT